MNNYILVVESNMHCKIHQEELVAIQEAERLCRKEGKRVFIYKAIGEALPSQSPVKIVKYEED